eukprot:Rhum_TRINITY_DN9323_c0_g1::Rhum_TRINITY_DN9323_c0_g1_i1::g.32941::m.32941
MKGVLLKILPHVRDRHLPRPQTHLHRVLPVRPVRHERVPRRVVPHHGRESVDALPRHLRVVRRPSREQLHPRRRHSAPELVRRSLARDRQPHGRLRSRPLALRIRQHPAEMQGSARGGRRVPPHLRRPHTLEQRQLLRRAHVEHHSPLRHRSLRRRQVRRRLPPRPHAGTPPPARRRTLPRRLQVHRQHSQQRLRRCFPHPPQQHPVPRGKGADADARARVGGPHRDDVRRRPRRHGLARPHVYRAPVAHEGRRQALCAVRHHDDTVAPRSLPRRQRHGTRDLPLHGRRAVPLRRARRARIIGGGKKTAGAAAATAAADRKPAGTRRERHTAAPCVEGNLDAVDRDGDSGAGVLSFLYRPQRPRLHRHRLVAGDLHAASVRRNGEGDGRVAPAALRPVRPPRSEPEAEERDVAAAHGHGGGGGCRRRRARDGVRCRVGHEPLAAHVRVARRVVEVHLGAEVHGGVCLQEGTAHVDEDAAVRGRRLGDAGVDLLPPQVSVPDEGVARRHVQEDDGGVRGRRRPHEADQLPVGGEGGLRGELVEEVVDAQLHDERRGAQGRLVADALGQVRGRLAEPV